MAFIFVTFIILVTHFNDYTLDQKVEKAERKRRKVKEHEYLERSYSKNTYKKKKYKHRVPL